MIWTLAANHSSCKPNQAIWTLIKKTGEYLHKTHPTDILRRLDNKSRTLQYVDKPKRRTETSNDGGHVVLFFYGTINNGSIFYNNFLCMFTRLADDSWNACLLVCFRFWPKLVLEKLTTLTVTVTSMRMLIAIMTLSDKADCDCESQWWCLPWKYASVIKLTLPILSVMMQPVTKTLSDHADRDNNP